MSRAKVSQSSICAETNRHRKGQATLECLVSIAIYIAILAILAGSVGALYQAQRHLALNSQERQESLGLAYFYTESSLSGAYFESPEKGFYVRGTALYLNESESNKESRAQVELPYSAAAPGKNYLGYNPE